jgi:hypothetical protein
LQLPGVPEELEQVAVVHLDNHAGELRGVAGLELEDRGVEGGPDHLFLLAWLCRGEPRLREWSGGSGGREVGSLRLGLLLRGVRRGGVAGRCGGYGLRGGGARRRAGRWRWWRARALWRVLRRCRRVGVVWCVVGLNVLVGLGLVLLTAGVLLVKSCQFGVQHACELVGVTPG